MSNRIAVMNQGRIEQIGKPREIYTKPATRFVAEFIGTSNFMEGKVVAASAGEVSVDTAHGRMVAHGVERTPAVGNRVLVSIRPECVDLSRERRGNVPNEWQGTVLTRAFLGDVVDHIVGVGDLEIRNRSNPTLSIPPGTEVHFSVAPDKVTLVPAD
ncbi:TOBE domain-containing protein [Streptomyces mexicanus]